ncbi:MAG: YeeE/YedE family protein [Bacteroidetes bacterium]|jgi:uncharacterized protein|nr:YeeE/YedE family protein [Bacteroidota bacterium]MBT3747519.1 YeeE/YedE family protein [Bacteroidota bacterium]MBT4399657.1 YeeE/YedE family protein [Bacteroidota bacterium]MBT4409544.1 YeeE/YedE family protein [Bacteroidota bacterium]MBT7092522.1 YeeE/YedE family protein [Bacteroidota bacterium]
MIITTLILGFLFGAILQYSRLNRFNTISGMAMLTDYTVAKAIAVAIGVGMVLINTEIAFSLATYHIKPFMLGGVMIGGLIFGAGMAILGYCPGTMAISLGEGSVDALVGIIGGLSGGLVYTIVLPNMAFLRGPDLGKISLYSLTGSHGVIFFVILIVLSVVFIAAAFWLNKIEKSKKMNWLYAGIGLALLNAYLFLTVTENRGMGASTFYPYIADLITQTTDNDYFTKITKSGNWQIYFLGGAMLSGLVLSLIRGDFKLITIHENWRKYKGESIGGRVIWAFIGGFILIFGARLAGGCTSGHVISGGMQVSLASLVFAAFVFAGLLITGRFFYKK